MASDSLVPLRGPRTLRHSGLVVVVWAQNAKAFCADPCSEVVVNMSQSPPPLGITKWSDYEQRFRQVAVANSRDESFIAQCLEYAKALRAKRLPIVFDSWHLSVLVGVDFEYLMSCSNCPERFYRQFEIAKRSGKSRTISEPLPTLKAVQRWILDNVLSAVPPSKYAKAYAANCSIREHARFHQRQKRLVLLDIKDFFPSIDSEKVFRVFRRMGYIESLCGLLTGLCTLNGGLPQGAPTSPMISNLVCKRIDARLGAYCQNKNLRYSRYADDMAISGDVPVGAVIRHVEKVLGEEHLRLNHAKTRAFDGNQRQIVTGIVVNRHRQVPREYRRRIRQELYYISKYGLANHMSETNIAFANYRSHLLGKAYHVLFVNPSDRDARKLIELLSANAIFKVEDAG